ncbi:MAG: gamma-glutamyl-gamma-aminobutyrate hydrolase family protein [bacterium]|nr:gamma-glutamyl-gamma-aminobutyrate hydrolase family protein [Candidatus Aquidulcis sp.]
MRAPLILITVADHDEPGDAAPIHLINARYADGVRRAGGIPILMSANASEDQRATAFHIMDGLLLSGGADIDPARYHESVDGAVNVEPARDALEWAALDAADRRGIPVFGICRGLQFLNVHRGGSLLQHVEGQVGAAYPATPALSHPITVQPGTTLAQILGDQRSPLVVNSYHHQAVSPERLAPGLRASALTDSPRGTLVEGLEEPGERFVLGVQCHPERTESSPADLELVWSAFISAARPRQI